MTKHPELRTRILRQLLLSGLVLLPLAWLSVIGYQETVRFISIRLTEARSLALATALSRALEVEFAALPLEPTADSSRMDQLVNTMLTANEWRLRALLQDTQVEYFDIHDLSGRAIYTTHPDHLGSSHGEDRYFAAARAGMVSHHLDRSRQGGDGTAADIRMITFVPIHSRDQQTPLGVLGLYGSADTGLPPHDALRALLAAAFTLAPLALLMLAGGYLCRNSVPLLKLRLSGAGPDSAALCHTITAQESERKRIARDLHDGIGQYLNAIKFHLQQIVTDREDPLSSRARKEIQGVVAVVASASDEVRRISLALRPMMLDDLGLLATISWLCREFTMAHPKIALQKRLLVEEQDIPDAQKITAYRILQEALSNVAKHSHATRVDIGLEKRTDDGRTSLVLSIEDNGVGFDRQGGTTPCKDGGLGLHSMRERAELSGATLEIDAESGAGTRIRVCWPWHENTA